MIGKLVKGRGARGLLDYLFAEKDSNGETRHQIEHIGGTLPGRSPRELAQGFAALHALRPSVGVYVAHVMLRWKEPDRPDLETQRAMMDDHLRALGFQDFVIVAHDDHIHAAASRIKRDGSVVSDRYDWKRAEMSVRGLEERYGLTRLESSHLLEPSRSTEHVAAMTRGEMGIAKRGAAHAERQGREVEVADLPHKPVLTDAVMAARDAASTVTEFVENCRRLGVEVRPNWSPQTGKVSGLSFFQTEAPDVEVSGSKLGRAFSWANLLKGGMTYDIERDRKALGEASQRAENFRPKSAVGERPGTGDPHERGVGGSIPPDPRNGFEPPEGYRDGEKPDRRHLVASGGRIEQVGVQHGADAPTAGGRDGGAAATLGERHEHGGGSPGVQGGEAGGRDEQSRHSDRRGDAPDRDRREGDPGGSTGGADGHGDEHQESVRGERHEAGERDQERRGGGDPSQGGDGLHEHDDVDRDGDSWRPVGRAFDRVVALGLEDQGSGLNKTLSAVRATIHALGCDRLLVGIMPPRGVVSPHLRPMNRTYTAEQLGSEETVRYLRRCNREGYEIYVRPASQTPGQRPPVFLVDDVTPEAVEKMRRDGLEPCLVGSTSSKTRLQAWVRAGREPVTDEEARDAARFLASRYGGDADAAKVEQFGRLFGFTNRKPLRIEQNGGQPPWTRVIEAVDRVATVGTRFLSYIRQTLAEAAQQRAMEAQQKEAARARIAQEAARRAQERQRERRSEGAYDSVYRHWVSVSQGKSDLSAIDFGAACGAIRDGHEDGEIRDALRAVSPDLEKRHHNVDRYLERTVGMARDAVEVEYAKGLPRPGGN